MLPGGPLCVDPFEDLDRIAGTQLDDRLLPAPLLPALQAAALRLRLHLGDVHAQHLDAEEFLDGLPHLRLVRVRMDAEGVRVAAFDLGVTLLGHDRGKQDFIGMQAHDAFSCTRSSASCVTRTERAHTSAVTSSLSGVVTTTFSMLRKDLETFCSSPVTTTTGSSCPQFARSSTAARVDGSEKLAPSRTPNVPSAACCDRTPRNAERRAFRFTLTSKSRGVGANATPPPVQWGARVVPARARPVPFWRHGFARPPRTSPRLLAARVPARSAFSSARTVSCTTCGFSSAPKMAASSVTSFDFLPAESSKGAFGAAINGPPLA